MNTSFRPLAIFKAICLTALLAITSSVRAAPPDLTVAGAIATLKADANASPAYGETYNLGPTGLRGWIYIGGGNGADGTITSESRQILVTVASTPGNAVLAVDDVILGAMAASSGTVPLFTSDARKAFGAAIGEAEKTGAGTLRVKRWRAGTTSDENIPMTIMGDYTATAPYSCPKSALVLTNSRNQLVGQLLADPAPSILTSDWRGAINGLALLAGVAPGDPDYATVQDRLQTYARALAGTPPQPSGLHIWNWAYLGLFLGEYYLSTGDANVIPGVSNYSVALAQAQSMYGTFGHNAAVLRPDGSGRRSNIGYGPLNQVGIVANMAIFMGRKSLVAAGQALDPEIDPAIQRGLDFFAWFVNKGPIPYGEHEPFMDGHSPNGKDASCAVLFGLQTNRLVETEYFTRMTTAGFTGREYGHTGQGFSYLWGAMGANMGGALAVAEYLKPVRWHLDLSRRTDGSFTYDGQEQYGGGKTADGTYLGASGYYQMNPTASYILTYSLPLQRLYITGRNAIPANTLDAAKVTNAIAAATFKQDCTNQTDYPVSRLISALSEYDPVVRHFAAIELGNRSLSGTQLTTLRNMLTGTDANGRMGACQALGLLQDPTALPVIAQRLDKTIETNSWVRAKAATAIRSYAPATASAYCDAMLANFAANATDPDVIDWSDPVQISNRYLSLALFGDAVHGGNNIATSTISASKSLLYPAVQAGLKQPDSYPRHGAAKFCYDRLTLADVQALPLDFIKVIEIECLADRMWGAHPRASGIKTLAKYKISEGIPLALAMLEIPKGFEWGSDDTLIGGLNALAAYGDAARWTLPALRGYLGKWSPTSSQHTTLVTTIASIEAAITAPTDITHLMAVANSQVVTTTAAKAITLTGTSPRSAVTFDHVTAPAHGTLTGTAPNLIYTPTPGYSGPDFFTFQTVDSLTTSAPGTVSIIVGTAGTGLKGEYFDNIDFTNLKLTRTDAQVNFDWGTGSPNAALGADTFSVRWDGLLLVPETGTYIFSTLNSDGVRLYVNGVPVIDGYADQNTHWNDGASVNLTAGQLVDLHLRYYENTGSAVAKLKWTGPSFAGANGAIIGSQWLNDGTGMTRTPYAHSQSVTLIRNTPQPITLMGSGGTLTYTVVTPPANGVLTGTAPNLVYTPAANYSGSDSFTFLVNNGTSNSNPATVSISVWAGQPTDFFWAAAASGNWSGASSWTNAAGATVMPDSAGQPFYRMTFDQSGTYTATQDLSSGFLFNQLNVAGAVTFAGTNSLTFAANGTLPPQFNQNSASAVAIDVPVSLTAMTTFGGSNSGAVTLEGLVSGSGGLTKSNGGTLQIHGLTPNPYSGGTVVNNGTLQLGAVINGISPNVVNPVGTGPVTLNGGTIRLEKVATTNALIVNGGTFYHQNGWAATWSGPITLNASLTCDELHTLNCSGTISGSGGLIKVNNGTVVLSGANSSTGANRITAGTLTCTTAAALGTGSLDISTGAKVTLNYTGSRTIAALTYNAGPPLAPGTYGSTASPATNKNDTYFSGTGTVTILPATTTALALTGGGTPASPGTALSFTATVTGGTPTGNVTFYDDTTVLGSSALNGSYQAVFTTSSLAIGSHHITAQYVGNATNATSTSPALPVEIISLLPSAPTNLLAAAGNNSVGLTWTLSAGATSYYVKRSLASGGPYTVIGNPTAASYDDLTAVNGTTYYYVVSALNASGESANSNQASGVPVPQPSGTSIVSSPVATGPYDTAVTFTATVTVSGGPATGSITFKDGATVLGSSTLDGAGQAGLTTSALALASHSITATYEGDGIFGGSVSTPMTYVVTPISLTITGVTADNKIYDGNTNAALTGGAVSGGVVGGETVTVVPGSGTFASTNAGTWAVTATGFALGGANAGNYTLAAQPTVPTATITARPLVLTGTRVYDGTDLVAAAGLTISNKVGADDLTLTGAVSLTGKDAGSHGFSSGSVAPVLVGNAATGNTGANAAASFTVNVVSPVIGNTLIAVITTRGYSANRVSSISQTGVTWTKALGAEGINTNATSGSTTEIWIGSNIIAGAGTVATINFPAATTLRAAAVIAEYSGLLAVSPLDKTAGSSGNNTTASTGTTAATTQTNELWIGGIGLRDSTYTLGTPTNAFAQVTSANSTSTTTNTNAKAYFLEKIVATTATAGTSGTITSSRWSGAIATFKAASLMNLTLSGTAAANYTLTGLIGSVTITPKALVLTATPAVTTKTYDGLAAAALTGATLRTAETPGTGTPGDGTPHTGDAVTLALSGTFDTVDAGTAKPVTSTSTLSGAHKDNYSLTQPTGLSGAITPADLTVAAGHQSKVYGQTLMFGSGATQFTNSPLPNGETIGSVTLACAGGDAAAGVAGSPYPITPSAATGGSFIPGNYAINYVAGMLTVVPAATTTTLATSASPATYGVPVTLTATVVPAPGGGTVQFHDNAAALGGPVPLSGGQAQLVTSTLATGSHSITATYSGSTNHSSSTATAMTQVVDKATPTITTPPTATEITYGQTLANSTLSGGAGSVPGTFAFTAPATAPPVGTATHGVTFTPADAVNYQTATTSVSVTVRAAQTPFETWAADPAHGLTAGVNDNPLDDPDHDGFSNLLEFTLGGEPMLSSQAVQPKLTRVGGNWVFSYDRSQPSKSSTTQVVEYGSDLTGWTSLTIPVDTAGAVTITPGASSDHVEVSIPPQVVNGFVRLKVSH